MIICGIYKYTSPSGKTYIGSSKNIYKRIKIMSTQSILLKDKAHYAKEFEKQILWNADRYYMHRFYKLGEDMNFNEAMYYSKMGSFICTKNCELIDWIKNKLEGKLENCGKKTKEKSIYDLIKMIPQNGGSTTDNFNSIMHWEDAVW